MKINCSPNLPENDVEVVVMSTISQEINSRVEELGVKIIPTEKIEHLLEFEREHADMQIFHYNRETVFLLNECKRLQKDLKKYFSNVILADKMIKKDYPDNVLMNGVSINDKIICNTKTIDNSVKRKIMDKKVLHTNQGYTKCSICVVSDDAIITSDISIKNTAEKDYDVLLIKPGEIDLPGTNYGFIGGCSFKFNKNTLAFTGDIKKHSDYSNIKSFCLNHNVNLHSLSNRKLLDIGSIIPIK